MSTPTLGRWPVVIAGRARGELRVLASDTSTFDIVRKKLRELSYGQFTTNNQLAVRGSIHYIPIYRARLSNDLRIIYLIDLESDGFNKYDYQIIKILSISSRARVSYDFWVKVSKFLKQRGSEYRSRCIWRDVINTEDGPVHTPSSFLHKEYPLFAEPDPDHEGTDSTWGESEMNELHETVVLEKYIPVTKSLYNSILADMDAVLPIILSPDEKAIVRDQKTSVVIGRSGTGKTTALVYKMRANAQTAAAEDRAESLRQLFVTRSPVLTRRVAAYYKGLIESNEIANKSPEELQIMRQLNENYQPRNLLELDNEADLRDDLPARYSELTDAHFPLFISFDKLGQLLEADALGTDDALALARARLRRLVDFSTFKHQYWPKFDHYLTRCLDPALVFSEILGVIKGYGHDLTEGEYLSLSNKKSPLLANFRNTVYAIFRQYKKRSSTRGEIDAADRVRAIISARKEGTNTGSGVDHLFVDEVQDQLMADIYLLHSLCSNIDGGYWCGDTAQTINVGSSFRIKDMKAYLYEEMVSAKNLVPKGSQRKIAAPFSTFELTVNFRSHSGIVKYAASLVQLIYAAFPSSIDHMQPESAPIPGPRPLIFISPSWDEDLFVKCLLDRRPVDECPPFSPEQAIIVRSETTARSLRARLQNRCNVLTILECKGLEFDDLIVYGFFTESDVSSSEWNKIAVLEAYEEYGVTRFPKTPDMSTIAAGICSELKQLYVAVTRARHNCWLWDSGPTAEMMKGFWGAMGLIKVSDSINDLKLFAKTLDDPRRWVQRGEGFFSNGLYAIAETCFERAGWATEAQIANAYFHMSEAGKHQEDSETAKTAYILAAEKMKACIKLHSSHSAATLWYHAASCFEGAKDFTQASRAYTEGGFYDRALLVLFDAQDMIGCLEVILSYSGRLDGALLRRIKTDVSVYFLRQKDYPMARRFEELATEHLSDGLPADAVSCLIHDSKSPSAVQWSRNIISTFLWTRFGLNASPESKAKDQANLLIKLCNSQDDLLDQEGLQDLAIFEVIISAAPFSPTELHNHLGALSLESKAYPPRMIALQYHALKGSHWLSSISHDDFFAYLDTWNAYNTGFQDLRVLQRPSQDAGVRRLLGLSYSATSASKLIVSFGAPLHELIRKNQGVSAPRGKALHSDITMHSSDADMHIQTLFANHSKKERLALSSDLLASRWTQHGPSLQNDTQDKKGASLKDAVESTLLVLPMLDSAMAQEYRSSLSVFTKGNEASIRTAWSMRFFSFAFPSDGIMGKLDVVLRETHAGNSATCVYEWVSKALKLLDPLEHEQAFVTLLVGCVALIFELRSAGASTVVPSLGAGFKRPPHSPIPQGCPRQPARFMDDIFTFFQRESQWRIVSMHKNLQRMVRDRWFIDISVLIHLFEQTTQEIILEEQANAPWSSGGFSGVIAPHSWASHLVTNLNHSGRAYTLKTFSLGDFVNRMWVILVRISNGIPGYWSVSVTSRTHPGFIALRLLRSIIFVLVNLRPDHGSTRFVQDVLNQFVATMIKFKSTFSKGLEAMGFSISCLPGSLDRTSALAILPQICCHEEVVMLQRRRSIVRPDASSFGGRIIKFETLIELRDALACDPSVAEQKPEPSTTVKKPALGGETERITYLALPRTKHTLPGGWASPAPSEPPEPETLEPNDITLGSIESSEEPADIRLDEYETSQILPPALPPRPDTPTSIAELEEETGLTLGYAALLVSRAWRRSVERVEQRKRLWEFDPMGQLFEKYRQSFPKLGAEASARDKRALKLIRGPCINIVLGLRLLVEEIDAYAEALDKDIQVSESTPAQLDSTQGWVDELKRKAE
ncbi:unnamed protein product [Rhizoctonia solani]|uniref:UvrD-like helicase ATP-binding domain-containing protein n=1 Tax=Rhizoctonia solani TaxID=456999 RepID=A0A8H3HSI2_9AGAM|nr:unnamed protein product [Rhizoctonia solani]CAE6539339.1 unnamed protein product [Rhizoctonia solani]